MFWTKWKQLKWNQPYEKHVFIIGYHMYKTVWAPCIKKEFCDAIESTKLMNKYVIAVQRNDC